MNYDVLIKICILVAPEYKAGECPRVELTSNINPDCARLCQADYDCSGDLKCCRDVCGMSCQTPRRKF